MRFIDADILNEHCNQIIEDDWNSRTHPDSWATAYECFKDDIVDMPTIDPKDLRPKCTWERIYEDTWECSNCGALWTCIEGDPADNDMHFCPVCGAEIERVVE